MNELYVEHSLEWMLQHVDWYDYSIEKQSDKQSQITLKGIIDDEKMDKMIVEANALNTAIQQITYSCTFSGPSSAISISNSFPPNTVKLDIKRVIHNAPATVIMWNDGTKTVVKAHHEPFDLEKGFAMAVCKKLLGDSYKKTFLEYCGKEENK